jgi:hypothetical protein
MICKLMFAALALLMTSGAAFGAADVFVTPSTPELDAVETTTLAQFTGNQKHNRCPRFRVIDAATSAELAAAGMRGDRLPDPPDDLLRGDGTSFYVDGYATDPSAFCKKAWELLGPNGTYRRQLLEAK